MKSISALCSELEKNISDEAEARSGYYKLLSEYAPLLSQKEISLIKTIIVEELDHTNVLKKMVEDRSYLKEKDWVNRR